MDKTLPIYDVLIVGGGINGAGIARDLAGRGLSVLLCERDDLAAHTSSSSTKLIHGGLRYLEYYEFSLVRKALQEREVLLRSAPHIMWPLRFVMPHDAAMRPVWIIRAGLFLYDHLAKREILAGSEVVSLREHAAGAPLRSQFKKGFVYSDGWVDDARLVVLNVLAAQESGATIMTQTSCLSAQIENNKWRATLQLGSGETKIIQARAMVNAAGPWAGKFLQHNLSRADAHTLRLVKGSHIVVRKLFEHDYAYIFQNADKRITFAIPYENDFTLIGTTDVEIAGEPDTAKIDADEIRYLCAQASRYFAKPVIESDVVWSYTGVRPLLDDESGDPSAVTRDYQLEMSERPVPLLTVWGGKITTFRKLAQEAGDMVCSALTVDAKSRTVNQFLPGGDFKEYITATGNPVNDFSGFVAELTRRHPWLPKPLRLRYARAYGSRINYIIGKASSLSQLGEEIAPQFYAAEAQYLMQHEWAHNAQDMLWRRSKLGLHMSEVECEKVVDWCDAAVHTASKNTDLNSKLYKA
ncbi:MAG: glycerol-3-phosphate dehydrogenase [Burkholderiales bacterium]